MQDRATQFVVDTNALWWYLKNPSRLSVAAAEVFRMAESSGGKLIIPAIVVAELFFLAVKAGDPIPPSALFDDLASRSWIEFSDLGRAQLEYLDRLPEIPEMHDRLIAAESIIRDAPLVTRDRLIAASAAVETIW